MKPWKLLDSKYLVDAPWLKVAKETCELPNGKVIDDFYTLWQPDWVLILARTAEGNWVMTEQYRHGTGKIALEFPAGILNKGETPEQAALRELQEECGYGPDCDCHEAAPLAMTKYIGTFPVNPDRHRGVFHVVFIDGVKRRAPPTSTAPKKSRPGNSPTKTCKRKWRTAHSTIRFKWQDI